ncbi:ectonucleotide pyrophosphatase/phosphodiesterase [soil metagenome]
MACIRPLLAALLAIGISACAVTSPPASSAAAPAIASEQRPPVTILISIDALSPDRLGRGDTPVLDALARDGVKSTMRPSFPTLTFPNHTTMMTGLRPDRHGIVANIFYDPRRPTSRFYSNDIESSDPFWWAEAEPLWITAEKQGIHSGTMFWPGEEAAHGDVRPYDWVRFDPNFTSEQRIRTVTDWMRRPAAIRPRFVTIYFDDVDKAGHRQGPRSDAEIAAVRSIDRLIGDLKQELDALGQPVNFVIVSDHGMRAIRPERTVSLDRILPRESYRLVSYGPFATLDPLPGHEEQVAGVLLAPNPDMTCWRKADVPARYHYGANPRVAAFVCLAAPGSEVMPGMPTNKGDHGYDPDDPEMTALFLVNGPAFRRGARVPARFDNVDLYPMLARVIGVAPLPNDGDASTLAGLAKAP